MLTLILSSYSRRLCLVSLKKCVQLLYLILFLVLQKKSVIKELRKIVKEVERSVCLCAQVLKLSPVA